MSDYISNTSPHMAKRGLDAASHGSQAPSESVGNLSKLSSKYSWGINKFELNRMESSRTTQSFRIRSTYSNPAFLEGEDVTAGGTKIDGASSSDQAVAGRSSDDSVIVLGRFDSVMPDVDPNEVLEPIPRRIPELSTVGEKASFDGWLANNNVPEGDHQPLATAASCYPQQPAEQFFARSRLQSEESTASFEHIGHPIEEDYTLVPHSYSMLPLGELPTISSNPFFRDDQSSDEWEELVPSTPQPLCRRHVHVLSHTDSSPRIGSYAATAQSLEVSSATATTPATPASPLSPVPSELENEDIERTMADLRAWYSLSGEAIASAASSANGMCAEAPKPTPSPEADALNTIAAELVEAAVHQAAQELQNSMLEPSLSPPQSDHGASLASLAGSIDDLVVLAHVDVDAEEEFDQDLFSHTKSLSMLVCDSAERLPDLVWAVRYMVEHARHASEAAEATAFRLLEADSEGFSSAASPRTSGVRMHSGAILVDERWWLDEVPDEVLDALVEDVVAAAQDSPAVQDAAVARAVEPETVAEDSTLGGLFTIEETDDEVETVVGDFVRQMIASAAAAATVAAASRNAAVCDKVESCYRGAIESAKVKAEVHAVVNVIMGNVIRRLLAADALAATVASASSAAAAWHKMDATYADASESASFDSEVDAVVDELTDCVAAEHEEVIAQMNARALYIMQQCNLGLLLSPVQDSAAAFMQRMRM